MVTKTVLVQCNAPPNCIVNGEIHRDETAMFDSRGRSSGESGKTKALAAELRRQARPLASPSDLDPLLDRIGDARYVLLGEASHGTSEYYGWRGAITRRLIAERGFSFIAVEGDWPDCFTVNQWVKGRAEQESTARQ